MSDAQRYNWQIHCPNPEKFPRFAAGFQGQRCKNLGPITKVNFLRAELPGGAVINIDPNWIRRAA